LCLRDDGLDRDLDERHNNDEQRDPGIDRAAPPARDRHTERDPAADLGPPEDAEDGRDHIEHRVVERGEEFEDRLIELAESADGDERAESDESRREQNDPDQR